MSTGKLYEPKCETVYSDGTLTEHLKSVHNGFKLVRDWAD